MKVIGVGDNVCDKYKHTGMMYPGGQALNFAVYARLLGHDSAFLGVLGTDDVAAHILSTLDVIGVEHPRCVQKNGENGYTIVDLKDGERTFLYSNKGGISREQPISFSDDDLQYISGFELLHTSNNSHLDDKLSLLSGTGVPVSYDFSTQWTDEARLKNAKYIQYAFLSCADTPEEKIQNVCKRIADMGCFMIIATRGKQGTLLYNGDSFFVHIPQLVEAIDTLGAGDSFATAFLLQYIPSVGEEESHRINKALQAGADFSAKICMIHGAFGYGKAYNI